MSMVWKDLVLDNKSTWYFETTDIFKMGHYCLQGNVSVTKTLLRTNAITILVSGPSLNYMITQRFDPFELLNDNLFNLLQPTQFESFLKQYNTMPFLLFVGLCHKTYSKLTCWWSQNYFYLHLKLSSFFLSLVWFWAQLGSHPIK